jgi:hypothetical protein
MDSVSYMKREVGIWGSTMGNVRDMKKEIGI